MVPRVFSDPSDFVPHFVPLCGPGGFHGCDLPPVLPGAGNPSSASVPLASGTPFRRRGVRDGRDDGLRQGAAPRARRPLAPPSPGGGRACSPSGGRRRARGPRRARPTAVACHGQVGVKGAASTARPASRGATAMARSALVPAPGRRDVGIEPIGIRRPRPRHPRSAPDSRGTSAIAASALARSLGHCGGTGHRGRGRDVARGPDGCGATNDDGRPAVDSGHINSKRHQPDTVA